MERVGAAMQQITSFHIEGEIVLKASKESEEEFLSATFQGDVDSEGDSQMLMAVTVKAGVFSGSLTLESRKVNGTSYTKNLLTGQWESTEGGNPFLDILDVFGAPGTGDLGLGNVVSELDTLNGEAVYRISGSPLDDPTVEGIVWVGVDDLLIRQMQMGGKAPAGDFEGLAPQGVDEVFLSFLLRFSRYNEPVDVVAP